MENTAKDTKEYTEEGMMGGFGKGIVAIAQGNPDFSILVSVLQKSEHVETHRGEGRFVVFAPTDARQQQPFMTKN